jgi:molybdenum storage protein
MLIGTGGGTRARHAYSLAAELGLPTGVLTDVGSAVAGQNATMLGQLMAKYGVPVVGGDALAPLPLRLGEVGAAIFAGMPPYEMWQHIPAEGVVTSIKIFNGLKPGLLTRALAGEHVGTIISA